MIFIIFLKIETMYLLRINYEKRSHSNGRLWTFRRSWFCRGSFWYFLELYCYNLMDSSFEVLQRHRFIDIDATLMKTPQKHLVALNRIIVAAS